jgi:hypothetical protein
MKKHNSKASIQTILYFLILALLVLLLLVSIYSGYILYNDFYGKPQNLSVILPPDSNDSNQHYGDVKQFNKNMKFNHNLISVKFFDCTLDEESRMSKAFEIITNETGIIPFKKTNENPDIEILCSEANKQTDNQDSDYFIAGEGGAKEIIQTNKYNVIVQGSVLLYDSQNKGLKCSNPTVELHELIHVFGFDHSPNPKSLMYPYLSSCDQKLDSSIVNELKKLYSESNLPDLYFDSFSQPVKKGRYINLNFTIKNSGTVDAENATFSILEDNQVVETHLLGTMRFGAGVSMKMENIKLKSSNPEKISIIIDNDNNLKELDRVNNIAEISF